MRGAYGLFRGCDLIIQCVVVNDMIIPFGKILAMSDKYEICECYPVEYSSKLQL